jgi:hypothetical protein
MPSKDALSAKVAVMAITDMIKRELSAGHTAKAIYENHAVA